MPAPGPAGPRSRVGDADRERLVALLREHYAHGRLSLDELQRRVGIVLAAEYADEAASAVEDLPPLDVVGRPARKKASRGRHAQAATPGAGWVPTSELFRDPSTGRITRVWIDPADHSRHYVPEPDS